MDRCDRQRIGYLVALKDEEQDSWQQFKELDEGVSPLSTLSYRIVEARKKPIGLEYPIVKIAGDFAIRVYNESYKMHAKEQHDIFHEYEIMGCKYIKVTRKYYFYITIEAVGQGNLGVYEAKVEFESNDGRMTLLMFLSTGHTPVGKRAMEMADLTRVRSFYECVKGLKKEINIHLETSYMSLKGKKKAKMEAGLCCRLTKAMYLRKKGTRMSQACGKNKGKVAAELIRLKKDLDKASNGKNKGKVAAELIRLEKDLDKASNGKNKGKVAAELIRLKKYLDKASNGLGKVLYQDIERFFPPACQRTNQDVDEDLEYSSDLEDDVNSGMVRREDGTTHGYDYYNPLVGGLDLGFFW